MFKENTIEALRWVVDILKNNNVSFQLTGGFAAKLYGSTRELADIDIDIEENGFEKIFDEVKDYIIYGPKQYKDSNWDLMLMTLKYKNQIIDIAGEEKIFDHEKKVWIQQRLDFTNGTYFTMYDLNVPVIPEEKLINYKKKINREVDIEDVKELENN